MENNRQPGDSTCLPVAELQLVLQHSPVDVVVVDVRSPEEFAGRHLPDAVNIPLADLPLAVLSWSRAARVITVCGKGGGRSAEAAKALRRMGFSDAVFLCEGAHGWFSAG